MLFLSDFSLFLSLTFGNFIIVSISVVFSHLSEVHLSFLQELEAEAMEKSCLLSGLLFLDLD